MSQETHLWILQGKTAMIVSLSNKRTALKKIIKIDHVITPSDKINVEFASRFVGKWKELIIWCHYLELLLLLLWHFHLVPKIFFLSILYMQHNPTSKHYICRRYFMSNSEAYSKNISYFSNYRAMMCNFCSIWKCFMV